ncbi:MAG: autotransporter domain-containing protein [Pseudomonadota bacterium]
MPKKSPEERPEELSEDLCSAATALALILMSLFVAPAVAQEFDRQVVFGDSLSDPGNIFPDLRFTNGPLYAEILQQNFRIDDADVFNSAVGGAKTSQSPNPSGFVTGNISDVVLVADTDLTNQSDNFLDRQGGAHSSTSLFIVNGGGNNGFVTNQISFLPSTTDPIGLLQSAALQASSDLVSISSSLISAGAQTIVVPNSADLGAVAEPFGFGTSIETESRSRSTIFTNEFNAALVSDLGALAATTDTDIILVDVNTLFADAQANPEKYGISNVTDACSSTPSCVTASFDDQNQFLFFDGVHPTAAGHTIKGQFYTDTILAPFVLGGVAETLRDSAEARRQRFAQGFVTTRLADRAGEDGIIVFVDSGYLDLERNAASGILGYEADGFDTGGGIGKVFDANWAAAIYGGISRFDGLFETRAAGFDIDAYYFGGLAQGNLPYNILFTADVGIQFSDIVTDRDTGVANQSAIGEQETTSFSVSGRVSKDHYFGNFVFTPEVALGYFRADLDAYQQSGATGLDLAVRGTDVDAAYAEIGGRLARPFSLGRDTSIIPSARVLYRTDFNEFDQTIVTDLVSAPGVPRTTFINGYADNSLRLEGGVVVEAVDGFMIDLNGGGLLARNGESSGYFISARVSVGF